MMGSIPRVSGIRVGRKYILEKLEKKTPRYGMEWRTREISMKDHIQLGAA